MDKLCAHSFWGPSSALDLLSISEKKEGQQQQAKSLWVLQVCAGDCRHVLRTLSTLFEREATSGAAQESNTTLGFKIYESKIELLARQILLLLVVFDTGRDLKERIDLLLEIHGNIELTEKTETDIDCYAQVLEKWITSLKPDKVGSVLRFFDVSELKYQEKDELLRVFKSWRKRNAINAQALWDYRIRKYYGDRYDFRKNLIDWDYHMRLSKESENVIKSEKSIIHFLHFRNWRMTGISHELRDKKYNTPNRTLLSTVASRLEQFKDRNLDAKGTSVTAYGYWGDIQNPPYFSFGVTCWNKEEEGKLFKRTNKQFEHTAVDVSKSNLNYFGKLMEKKINTSDKICHCHLIASECDQTVKLQLDVVEQYKFVEAIFKNLKIKFLTGDKIRSKKKTENYDYGIISCRNAHLMQQQEDLKCDSVVIETVENLLEVTDEHQEAFSAKLLELAKASNWLVDTKSTIKDFSLFHKL